MERLVREGGGLGVGALSVVGFGVELYNPDREKVLVYNAC